MRGIHRSSVNSPRTGQWRGALMFSLIMLICDRINGWVNNREAGDWRRHFAHYDVTIMKTSVFWYTNDCEITHSGSIVGSVTYIVSNHADEYIKSHTCMNSDLNLGQHCTYRCAQSESKRQAKSQYLTSKGGGGGLQFSGDYMFNKQPTTNLK